MKVALFIFLTLFSWLARAQVAGGENGNGGDPLMILFEEARHQAAQRIANATYCAFPSHIRPDVINWILNNRTRLIQDVLNSKHVWITDPQVTCAFTQPNPEAQITLSFTACRPQITSVLEAGKTLVHESTHHFGITDEVFPTEVAYALYSIGQGSGCNVPPAQNPFDPASCPGAAISHKELYDVIPLPYQTSKNLGSYKAYMRQRVCYRPDRCKPWEESEPKFIRQILGVGTNLASEGSVNAVLENDTVSLKLASQDGTYFIRVIPNNMPFQASWHRSVNDGSDLVAFDSTGPKHLIQNIAQHPNTWKNNWLSRQCVRIFHPIQFYMKDGSGNTMTVDWEIVLLSQFKY